MPVSTEQLNFRYIVFGLPLAPVRDVVLSDGKQPRTHDVLEIGVDKSTLIAVVTQVAEA